MMKIDVVKKSSLCVNPGYKVSQLQISLKSIQSVEREKIINILIHFRVYNIKHYVYPNNIYWENTQQTTT